VADIVALRLLREAADGHILNHAATKRAYGRLAHGERLEVRLLTLDPQAGTLPVTYLTFGHHRPAARLRLAHSAFVH
jgi:hypothetical protein